MTRHLLVTNDFPPKVGGIQSYLDELWRRLDPSTFAVLTASSDERAPTFDAAWASSGRQVLRSPKGTLFLPTRANRRRIEDAIAATGAEFVLLDPAWPLGLLGPQLSVPYGVVLHGAEVTIPARIPFVAATLRRVLTGSSVAICAGTYPEAEAVRCHRGPLRRAVQVPPGVDTARFAPLDAHERAAVRADLSISDDAPFLFSYSRLVPRKGMDVLIAAAHARAAAYPGHVLAIGGRGRDRKRLERLGDAGPADVRFLDFIADDDLPRILGAADCFAMMCRNRWFGLEQEGFGIVFVEAAAAGIPAVAGRSGGSADAVVHGGTGLIVEDPRDVASVVASLERILGDPAYAAQLGAAARARAVKSFDYDILGSTLGRSLSYEDASDA